MNKLHKYSFSISHILLFFYIFNFRLIKNLKFSSSSIVIAVFLTAYMFFNRKYMLYCLRWYKSKYNLRIIVVGSLLILIMCFTTIMQDAFDFEIVRLLINELLIVEIGFLLIAFMDYKEKKDSIIDILIDVFFIQSLIQNFSIVNEKFRNITNIFRDDAVIMQSLRDYGGARGTAISGSAFFGLAVAYGILFVIIVYHWKEWKYKHTITRVIVLVILCLGAISAGRTSFVGIAIALLYFFIENLKKCNYLRTRNGMLGFCFIMCILLISFCMIVQKSKSNYSLKIFFEYSSEFFRNFMDGKGLSSSSTESLFGKMYFSLNFKQILIGDGRYIDGGLYYMHTDAGYMRTILFGGIGAFFLLLYYQIQFMNTGIKYCKILNFNIFILLSLLVFEIKGDVIGMLQILQAIFTITYGSIILNSSKNNYRG